MSAKNKVGKVLLTRRVSDESTKNPSLHAFIFHALARHASGDWGDISESDKAINDQALSLGNDRILSSYNLPSSEKDLPKKIWIITEQDHEHTTILFPDDY